MKKLIILSVLVLAGCKTTQNHGLTYNMNEAQLKEAPIGSLCIDSHTGRISQLGANELRVRNVDCRPILNKMMAGFVPTLSSSSICNEHLFMRRDEITAPYLEKEIKKRGLNCSEIMQAEFSRQNAVAAQDAADAQRRAAGAAWANAFNANRPRTTNCTGYGYSATCRSY